jgi:ferredoxin-NADP reductase
VTSTRPLTPRVRSIMLSVSGWEGHLAGQHVDVRLTAEDGYQASRSYSIASAPELADLELIVERLEDGEVSSYLCDELRVGDRLELRGPVGGYFVWKASLGSPLLLVAGGSGIAPLMAMIRHRHAASNQVPVRLLYSSRSPEDAIYRDELNSMSSTDAAFEVIHTFTRSQPPGWTGYRRRVDVDMLREVAWPKSQEALAYICGPTLFVESVADGLVTLGYPAERVRTERFGPTGV